MQAHEMAIRAVKNHKGVDISYPRAIMAVFDLIYPETSGHIVHCRSRPYVNPLVFIHHHDIFDGLWK